MSYVPPPRGSTPPPNHPQAVLALVLGILSLVLCGPLGPFAWLLGARAVRQIDASPGRYGGRDIAQAGMWLGIAGTVLTVLLVVAFIVIFGPVAWSLFEAFDDSP